MDSVYCRRQYDYERCERRCAWNWTTGETKSQLANQMITLSSVPFAAGPLSHLPSTAPIVAAGLWFLHRTQKENYQIEELQKDSIESGVVHPKVYRQERECAAAGPLSAGCSAFVFSHAPDSASPEALYCLGAGSSLISLSCYVMRANSLPPRDPVWKRAKDGLVEMVENYRAKPAPVPVE